ncbi:hypothetical protein JXE04_03940 [Patescibacteria group bacterium]|nr:hypothetical protein [Patescibacteria group bacterium]
MFIIGALIIAVGAFLVIKTEWFMTNFGRIAWFEDKLGSEGGSRIGYKLVGILAIFIGIILLTGNGSNFFTWMFSPLMSKI